MTDQASPTSSRTSARWLGALIPPIAVFLIQWAAWDVIRPYAWFMFYPAIITSSWLGGLRGGVSATALSALLIWWFFIPPEESLPKHPLRLIPGMVFLATGAAIGAFVGRSRSATERLRQVSDDRRRIAERLASLVELAPEGIFVAGLDGRYLDVNAAGCRLLGYSRDELTMMTIVDLIPPEDVGRLEQDKAELLRDGTASGEWRLRRKDGTYVEAQVTAKILPDGQWLALVHDISERKRLEIALQAKSADFERAQSVAQVGSWRLDIQRNELRWSNEAYRIFGAAIGTPMTYERFLACVHPDDRAYVDRMWTAALHGAPYDIEHRLLVGGTTKWVRERADLEFDDHGALLGGIGITQDITERKRLEAEIRHTQERLELALDGAELAAWDWNVRTGDVAFNSRWAEMRGYRPDEVSPTLEAWTSSIHPDDRALVERTLDDHFAGRRSEYEAEHRVQTKAGGWIWILDRGKVVARDQHGEPLRMAGTALDITARKRAEEELRSVLARSTGIMMASADAIISVDEDQRITMFNEGAERIFGYSKTEAIGAPLGLLIPDRLRDAHRTHVATLAAGRDVSRKMGERIETIRGKRKDGSEFPADASICKLEVDGELILTVTVRDITDQKRVEREQTFLADVGLVLAASREIEDTLSQIAALAVRDFCDLCIVDLRDEHGSVHRESIVFRDPSKAWIAEQLEHISLDPGRASLTSEAIRSGTTVLRAHVSDDMLRSLTQNEHNLELVRAADPRSLIAAPLLAHGARLGAIAFVSSTPTHLFGAEDARIAEELARRAALAIENAQLYGVARRAIEARDDALGIVAHDLRNPLSAIALQADLLGELGGAEERKAAELIRRSARRMDRLIQDLLDVTRMEAHRLTVDPSVLSTNEIVDSVIATQRQLARRVGLDIEVEVADHLPALWADRDRLLQIFENLIGNALKFTEHGGITIGAALRDGEVLFWVRDTGSGIPADALPHLFDRFWQGQRERRAGAGLGLAIVKGLVEAQGGRIWVDSTPGQGTCFYFTIPVAGPSQWSESAHPA